MNDAEKLRQVAAHLRMGTAPVAPSADVAVKCYPTPARAWVFRLRRNEVSGLLEEIYAESVPQVPQ